MSNQTGKGWVPEICYEELEGGLTSKIPFISVPEGKVMPGVIFIFESRETGEFEPGQDGEELPVTELNLHQYADMELLKNSLTLQDYDKVRIALGLDPLAEAVTAGQKITSAVRESVSTS